MATVINNTVRFNDIVLRLYRRIPLKDELSKWEVLTGDKSVRLGIIRQVYDPYLVKHVGSQIFKVKYWLGSCFYPQKMVIGATRREVLMRMIKDKLE